MEIQSIKTGNKEEVTFPSEDAEELSFAYRKEKIFLPAKLFENKGAKVTSKCCSAAVTVKLIWFEIFR